MWDFNAKIYYPVYFTKHCMQWLAICQYVCTLQTCLLHHVRIIMKTVVILKTLFNIVEARFKTLLNFDVCVVIVCWCSDESINSQEYKIVKNWYQDINDWISPFNKPETVRLMVYSFRTVTQQSTCMVENWKMSNMVNLVTCLFFLTFLKPFLKWCFWRAVFFREPLIFTPSIR